MVVSARGRHSLRLEDLSRTPGTAGVVSLCCHDLSERNHQVDLRDLQIFFVYLGRIHPPRGGTLAHDSEGVPVAVGAEDVVLGVVERQGVEGAPAVAAVQALLVEGAGPARGCVIIAEG